MASVRQSVADDCYKAPHIHIPSLGEVRRLAEDAQLDLTEEELTQYHDAVADCLPVVASVCELPQLKPPVKYPRVPGYQPRGEENKYNAWYYKSEIKGAAQGKLKGKRVAIKDNVSVAGVPMMNGSHVLEGFIPDVDATVVSRILDAGATIAGKSACEDLCYSGDSHSTAYGPILNPLDTSRSTGGSSSGSAALIATGEVDMAIGGDQGGSIRIPSSWCGIVGMKPTHGLVPYTGAASMCFAVDHLGPMAKSVRDCALLLEVIAGFDGMDSRQQEFYEPPKYSEMVEKDINGMKIGLLKEGFEHCDAEVQAVVRRAVEKLAKSRDVTTNDITIPEHKFGHTLLMSYSAGMYETMIQNAGISTSISGYQDNRLHNFLRRGWQERKNDASTNLKVVTLLFKYVQEKYGRQYYSQACNVAGYLKAAYNKVLEEFDVIIMPTLPTVAQTLHPGNLEVLASVKRSIGMVTNTTVMDVTGHPAVTLPVGHHDGLPVGLMVVGRRFDDATVLRVARHIEDVCK